MKKIIIKISFDMTILSTICKFKDWLIFEASVNNQLIFKILLVFHNLGFSAMIYVEC